MDFLAIIGDPGAGKTNMLVKYLYAEHVTHTKIISNLRTLKFPQTYMGFGDLLDAGDEIMDSYIGMDELGIGADSYDFLSKNNRGITKFVAQIRKFHCRCAYTVQRQRMISVRLRLLTDGYVSMTDPDKFNMFYPDGRKAKMHREVCAGIFRAEYWDRDMRLLKTRLFNGRKYWPMYDTDERISSGYKSSQNVATLDIGEDEDY
jgi:hypothetical protein